ncbi:hypothetical protein [Martelella alba]|uniref:Uncharacterized protein n=1 Tax=Martelella alba TaxID=2590451 RepID=A0ABY2SKE9_9HYPH|nr:hypothetical protein [Martelella alba]TKI04678.1 hypothetical protein FCN80_17095 [Martelella alba]
MSSTSSLPGWVQRFTQGANAPTDNGYYRDDPPYLTVGKKLYQLAQDESLRNATRHTLMPPGKLHIRSAAHAVTAGLYLSQSLSHTLACPAPMTAGAGDDKRPGRSLGYSPHQAGRAGGALFSNDVGPHSVRENDGEIHFKLVYVSPQNYPNYKGSRFIAIPVY